MTVGHSPAESKHLRLRWRAAFNHWENKLARWIDAAKTSFDPNQPRVPAGNPDGGQWADGGGGGGGSNAKRPERNSPNPRPTKRKPSPVKKLNPPIPKRTISTRSPLGAPPKISKRKPLTRQVEKRIAKQAAKWLLKAGARRALGPIGVALDVIDGALWLREHYPDIQSYFDEPKSLEELNRAVSDPVAGYEMHHIVEQAPAQQDGFPRSRIDATENLARIPAWKHREITGWYQTKNPKFGNRAPREFLRNKTWEERTKIGREALIKHGVLKP